MTLSFLEHIIRQDGLAFGLSVVALLGLVGAGEALRAWGGLSAERTRQLVHAGVGLFVAATPVLFVHPFLVYVLAVAFVGVNFVTLRSGWWPGIHGTTRRSLGTVAFPLGLIPALFFCWTLDPGRVYALQVAFVLLALADPLAAIVGRRWGKKVYGSKTVEGSAAFFGVALVVTWGGGTWLAGQNVLGWSPEEVVAVAVIVAGVTTVVEALGRKGWDNFFIVQAALVVLVAFDERPDDRLLLLGASVAGIVFGWSAYRLRALNASGALAGGLLAATVVGVGGWAWAVPSLTFFITSSVLSQVGRRRKVAVAAVSEKGSRRDVGQVVANGGAGWGLLVVHVFWPEHLLYAGFLGAFAAAAADTWGTEIGALSMRSPRLVTTGRTVPRGTSGAVSWLGTLGAIGGALGVALSAVPFFSGSTGPWSVLLIVPAGVIGAFLDSLAGATVQARFHDPQTGDETERPASSAGRHALIRGWAWLRNDQVNGLCTLSGALLAVACFQGANFAF